MNNRGISTIEILVVVGVFSLIYLVGVINVTFAFETPATEEAYNDAITSILNQSEIYAEKNSELFLETDTIELYINDLVEEGYLPANSNGDIVNPVDETDTLNDIKISIVKSGETYTATVVKN